MGFSRIQIIMESGDVYIAYEVIGGTSWIYRYHAGCAEDI